ncbi:MAG: FG-GAP repeat protein [Rhodothermaceae bacterium]|nr:FG-GAP repeat protein [Rhodothermaceae bacterium]
MTYWDRKNQWRYGLQIVLAMVLLSMPSVTHGQIFKIAHPDTTTGNGFGTSVAIDGDRALIGASAEDVCGVNSGAAYIYERDDADESWKKVTRLVPSDCVEGDFFGRSLSIHGDRAVVAASGTFPNRNASNAAYIFERNSETGEWKEVAKIKQYQEVEEGSFAASVSLDGDRLLVTTSGDPIRQEYNGAAYIYERTEDNRWVKKARLKGTGRLADGVFGGAGALDGDYAVVTASKYYEEEPGSLFIFERNAETDEWERVKHIKGIDDIFISVDIEANYVVAGESRGGSKRSGVATLYERQEDGDWVLKQTLKPRVPYKDGAFGSTVSFDGKNALVAGYDEQLGKNFNIDRVVYEFKRKPDSEEWTQRRIFDVGTVAFGYSIAASGGYAVIGEVSDQEPGAAYVVEIH